MRIAQITPGVIPIPPNGWGAVEKIIWEYTKVLRKLGHQVEIIYADDVKLGEWDIVHVHMANLALILKQRGIPYVFSHHDHHAYLLGKDSEVYKNNKEAIDGSVLSFVHAKYLVDYFGSPRQLRYLSHGANLEDYVFKDRSKDLIESGPKLIMMANNGVLGNPLFDRKGFIPGIKSAKELGLPITVVCPRRVNEDFFKANPDVSSYSGLTILYDLGYEESLSILDKHHVFLNPGILEAGHPNLTVTENIAMGIPVVGIMESDLKGMKRVLYKGETPSVSVSDLSHGINDVVKSYSSYVLECKSQRELFSWNVIVSRMLMDYASYGKVSQKNLILNDYKSTKITHRKNKESGYYYWFKEDPHFFKGSFPPEKGGSVVFRDSKNKSVLGVLGSSGTGSWTTIIDKKDTFVDWEIDVKFGSKVLKSIKMDLRNQHVLINKGNLLRSDIEDIIKRFVESTGCVPTLSFEIDKKKFPHFTHASGPENYYRVLNTDQIINYFSPPIEKEEHHLIILRCTSLGDTIGFIPYANEYAKAKGVKVSVSSKFGFLFDGVYPGISLIDFGGDFSAYTDVIYCDYIYDLPLQLGFAKQLELSHLGKVRPTIKSTKKERPIKKKYVCFSTHSTAQAKFWNNNNSWEKLCDMLNKEGLIPVCVDRYQSFGVEGSWNPIPVNCLNKTGQDLNGMMEWIEHCEFFIGLSSGLSWVAHGMGKKVVMISGVTSSDNEFDEDCIRIHRDDVCNSCFNFPEKFPFDSGDWHWCPVNKGTSKQFECTKRISAKQVMDRIKLEGWI